MMQNAGDGKRRDVLDEVEFACELGGQEVDVRAVLIAHHVGRPLVLEQLLREGLPQENSYTSGSESEVDRQQVQRDGGLKDP